MKNLLFISILILIVSCLNAQTLCEQFGDIPNYDQDQYLGVGGYHENSSELGTSNYGPIVTIVGDFVVDNNFTLDNAIVNITPGAKIIVTGSLTLNNSKLFSCNGMWSGIDLINGTIITSVNGTRIEDAINAIKVNNQNDVQLHVENTTFDRNETCISISLDNVVNNTPFFTSFKNNKFLSTGFLNDQSLKSQHGIFLKNVIFPIYQDYSGYNEFENLEYGIYSEGFFTLIKLNTNEFRKIGKAGIKMIGDYNRLILDNCSFKEINDSGVDIKNILELKVRNNCLFEKFENGENGNWFDDNNTWFKGIKLGTSVGGEILIENSKFNGLVNQQGGNLKYTGILLYNEILNGCNIRVINNQFDIGGQKIEGVWFSGGVNNSNTVLIEQNKFESMPLNLGAFTQFMISFENGAYSNVTMKLNEIDGFGAQGVGFWLNGVTGSNFEITSNYTPNELFGLNVMFRVRNSRNITICSNNAISAQFKYVFSGQNLGTDFSGNSGISTGDPILILENNTVIGPQLRKDNLFIPASPNLASVGAVHNDPDLAQLSRFTVQDPQSTSSQLYLTHPEVIIPDNGVYEDVFFQYIDGSINNSCATGVPPPISFNDLDIIIGAGWYNNHFTNEHILQNADTYLYDKILSTNNLHTNNSALVNFESNYSNSNLGHLDQIIYDLNNYSSTSLVNLTSLISSTNVNTNATTIFNDVSQIQVLKDIWQNERILQLSQIQNTLNTYNGTEQAFLTKKNFLEVYIRMLLNDPSLKNSSEWSSLVNTAKLCAEVGGFEVYSMRGLLDIGSYKLIHNDVSLCDENRVQYEPLLVDNTNKRVQNLEQLNDLSIYPNPNNGIFSVVAQENCVIEIINISNEVLKTIDINNGQNIIDISHYNEKLLFLRKKNDNSYSKPIFIYQN